MKGTFVLLASAALSRALVIKSNGKAAEDPPMLASLESQKGQQEDTCPDSMLSMMQEDPSQTAYPYDNNYNNAYPYNNNNNYHNTYPYNNNYHNTYPYNNNYHPDSGLHHNSPSWLPHYNHYHSWQSTTTHNPYYHNAYPYSGHNHPAAYHRPWWNGRNNVLPPACHRKHCMPQCKYTCTSPKCEETCSPVCLKPECQTRCPALNGRDMAQYCKVSCKKPQCEVHCPQNGCAGRECAQCSTVCRKPECKVTCPEQPPGWSCVDVCKQPKCMWKCTEPTSCPKPVCSMTCEPISGCMKIVDGFPPLHPGETVVRNIEPDGPTTTPAPQGSAGSAAMISTHKKIQKGVALVELETATSMTGSNEVHLVHGQIELPME